MAFWTDTFMKKVRQDWLKRIVKIQYYAGGVWCRDSSFYTEFVECNRNDNPKQFHFSVWRRCSGSNWNYTKDLYGANVYQHGNFTGNYATCKL